MIELEKEKLALAVNKVEQKGNIMSNIKQFRDIYLDKFENYQKQEEMMVKHYLLIIQSIWQTLDEETEPLNLLYISKQTSTLNAKVLLVQHLQIIVKQTNERKGQLAIKQHNKEELVGDFNQKFKKIMG